MTENVRRYCRTFDPVYLDDLDEFSEELIEAAEEYPQLPLSVMTINHFTQRYPRPSKLSGCTGLTYYTNKGMHVYLVSTSNLNEELCVNDNNTMTVTSWLKSVLSSADVFVDVLIQGFPMNINPQDFTQNPEYIMSQSAANRLMSVHQQVIGGNGPKLLGDNPTDFDTALFELYRCYTDLENCPYINSRIHYTQYSAVLSLQHKILRVRNGERASDVFGKKELAKLTSRPWDFVRDYIEGTTISDGYKTIEPRIKQKIFDVLAYYSQVYAKEDYLDPTLLVSDAYAISRMFQTYDTQGGRVPSRASNIIVLGLNDQIDFIEIVLKSLNFQNVYDSTPTDLYQCIHIDSIPYPLFR